MGKKPKPDIWVQLKYINSQIVLSCFIKHNTVYYKYTHFLYFKLMILHKLYIIKYCGK